MSESKILSIHYDDPHEVHKEWFDSVGDRKKLEIDHEPSITNIIRYALNVRQIPDNYDVIICEGSVGLRTALFKKIFNRNIKILRLVADQGLYEATEGIKTDFEERATHRFLDGAIANSDFMREYAEKYIDSSIEVVEPFVPELEKFLRFENEYEETKEICFVGYNYPNKNVEALVEAVKETEYRLHIVGKDHEKREQENIEVHGFVENLEEVFSQCDLYVQPSNGEAFGVAPLEAMAAEIPAVVTDTTGLKSTVRIIDEELVAKTSVEGIKTAIDNFYSKDFEERKRMAEKSREKASEFTKKKSLEQFRTALDTIVEGEEK